MDSDSQLKFIMSSYKRREILLLVTGKPMTLTELKNHFAVTSPELIPRLKELMALNLIAKTNSTYHITLKGNIFVRNLQSLLSTIEVVEHLQNFLQEHDTTPIPPEFLYRLDELGSCQIVKCGIEDTTVLYRQLLEDSLSSAYILIITPFYDPFYPMFFSRVTAQKIKLVFISTNPVIDMITDTITGEKTTSVSLYTSRVSLNLSMILTNTHFSLFLCDKHGHFDIHNYLTNNKVSLAYDLFLHYLTCSNGVTNPVHLVADIGADTLPFKSE